MLARTVRTVRTARAARPTLQTLLARPARQQQQQQKSFSVLHNLRAFARGFEPHPFQRLPVTSNPAPADWGRLVRRAGGQAVFYFPVGLTLLGWPYVARLMFDGRM